MGGDFKFEAAHTPMVRSDWPRRTAIGAPQDFWTSDPSKGMTCTMPFLSRARMLKRNVWWPTDLIRISTCGAAIGSTG
jgi:hypothetical protein